MKKPKAPEWHLEKRRLSKLKDYPFNPRVITPEAEEKLKEQLETWGTIDRPCITLEGTIIGGHQRTKALKKLGVKELEVWVPDRELSEKEIAKLNMELNKTGGTYDKEMILSLYDPEFLKDTGWTDEEVDDLWGEPLDGESGSSPVEEAPQASEPEVDENELEKKMDTYLSNTIRQVVLYFDVDTHKNVVERLEHIQKDNGLEDNSEAVLRLLEVYESQAR